MSLGVDSTVVGDGLLVDTLGANLDDMVLLGVVQRVDEGIDDISKDDLVARLVQEAGNKATANVAGSEVNSLLTHCGGLGVLDVVVEVVGGVGQTSRQVRACSSSSSSSIVLVGLLGEEGTESGVSREVKFLR